MWQHDKWPTIFYLHADDFGVKHCSKYDSDHLCNSIGANFMCAVDKKDLITAEFLLNGTTNLVL